MDSSNVEKAYIDATGTIKATNYRSSDNTVGASTTTGGLTFKDGLYTSGTATGGSSFDQDLNTDDDVEFAKVQTPVITSYDGSSSNVLNIWTGYEVNPEAIYFGESATGSNVKRIGNMHVYSTGGLEWFNDDGTGTANGVMGLYPSTTETVFEIRNADSFYGNLILRIGNDQGSIEVETDTLYLRAYNDIQADQDFYANADFYTSQNAYITGELFVDGGLSSFQQDLEIYGKLNVYGGIDPPYMLYDNETRASVIDRIRKEIPPNKANGIVHFYNSELNRMEYIKPATCEIMVQKADKEGIIGFHVVEIIDDGKPCYNTNVETEYIWDNFLGKVREVQKTVYERIKLPGDKEVNKDTGKVESKVEVTK
jgi:hypothetical protein